MILHSSRMTVFAMAAALASSGLVMAGEDSEEAKTTQQEARKAEPRGDLRRVPANASEDEARKKNPPLINLQSTTIGM